MASRNERTSTKTQELFHKINYYTCVMGLLNLWGDGARRPAICTKSCYVLIYKCIDILICVLLLLEVSAIFKRNGLDAKQTSDWIVLALTDPIFYSFYLNVLYYKYKIADLLTCLTVRLKNVYNDEIVEVRMVKRATTYTNVFLLLCCVAMALYGVDGLIQVVRLDKTFTTTITIWPDAEDKSNLAAAARIAYYLIWWFLVSRATNAYILAIVTTICLSHQFQNLKSYFYRLDDIFQDNELNQIEKEEKYEKAFKVGIKMHSDTIWCSRQCEIVYGVVYSGQIVITVTGLAVLMLQMLNAERSLLNALAIVMTASSILVTTGIYMWNAGDVTVEASIVVVVTYELLQGYLLPIINSVRELFYYLPCLLTHENVDEFKPPTLQLPRTSDLATAMYSSGWQNCRRTSSLRVQKLLVVAMTQAQKPIIIRGCGIVEMSYGSYLSIVKSSYSVFSVVY